MSKSGLFRTRSEWLDSLLILEIRLRLRLSFMLQDDKEEIYKATFWKNEKSIFLNSIKKVKVSIVSDIILFFRHRVKLF